MFLYRDRAIKLRSFFCGSMKLCDLGYLFAVPGRWTESSEDMIYVVTEARNSASSAALFSISEILRQVSSALHAVDYSV